MYYTGGFVMALTKNIRVYIYILVAAVALSACAKRDSDFKARKNAAGGVYVNGNQGLAADNAAAAAGYNTDILAIQPPQSNSNGALSVTSYIKVNNNNYQVVTTHTQALAISKTNQNFDGANFEVNGVCGTDTCSPYYLVINITRNGQQIKQTAMKKFFYYTGADSSQDLVMSLGAGEFLSVQDAVKALDSAVVEVDN